MKKQLINKNGEVRELTAEDFKSAKAFKDIHPNMDLNNITVKPLGRPKKETTKQAISIRLDADIIGFFKSSGKGWQSKINEVLRSSIS
ncbi:hypothetical protein MNB_SUP05-5-150 [hydrothermal vent metagenome]|uniref:BrnA antitoxin of type II toxin-antitoxin system n=1 Tax=hydrothermal vent metagenome TaxID=652676 RepID=A0A1W1CUL8_9ZZZZ